MELVKNKASCKFFLVLDDSGRNDFLLITPEGKIRHLERRLFDPLEIIESGEILCRQQLTESQIEMYADYSGQEILS